MTRKHIVGLIHDFLRTKLQEADEVDSAPAYILQDLFDCRVCAGHIIQVYIKGIMDGIVLPDGSLIFAGEKEVSKEELSDIMTKVCFPEFRTPRRSEETKESSSCESEEISFEQAKPLLQEEKNILTVDVRTVREYEQNRLPGSVNVPLLDIMKNPYIFSGNRNKTILLYCSEGVQSRAAAQCLLEAGYPKVAYFAWKKEM